ncbi:MAG: hypothetical protein H6747_09350 [Deltaproteobacteria bacterium]|nr:hypothetical protein [Deltaproteobacteria bacterium]
MRRSSAIAHALPSAAPVAVVLAILAGLAAAGCGGDPAHEPDATTAPDGTGASDAAADSDAADNDAADKDAADKDAADKDAADAEGSAHPDATSDVTSDAGSDASDALLDAVDAASDATDTSDVFDAIDGAGDAAEVVEDPCAPIGACIRCAPPAAGDPITPLPKPAPCNCDHGGPKFFAGQTPPAPSLQPIVGYQRYGEQAFVTYVDGGWAGLWKGPQGQFHIFLGVRVALPGQSGDKVKLQLEAQAFEGEALVAAGQAPTVWASREAAGSDVFRTTSPTTPGVWVVYPQPSSKSLDFCNHWVELVARVRVLGQPAWGQTSLLLRTYGDAKL